METINGITFEDWAAACGNLTQGMSEEQIMQILGIEKPVWDETNTQWAEKLGDLMTEDMSIATTYGEIFANPKVGKFANAQTPVEDIKTLLIIVPNYEEYQKIFWHQSIAAEHGIDAVSILESYGLDVGKWGALNMHYMNDGLNALDPNDPNYSEKFQEVRSIMDKWSNHWTKHYADQAIDLGGDIDF